MYAIFVNRGSLIVVWTFFFLKKSAAVRTTLLNQDKVI